MTIEELDDRHRIVSWHNVSPDNNLHTKLSIQFAIEVLEESITDTSYHEVDSFCKNKIQELKQYLDEPM